jgi:trehalose 6-phosphate synthase/phosphatase
VSNREPFEIRREGGRTRLVSTVGGLVSALDPVVRATQGVWVAWRRGEAGGQPFVAADRSTGAPYTLRVIPISEREAGGYYDGFSNRALWPVMHGFIGRARFDDENWADYRTVNERFAAAVADTLQSGDVVWIHDYQLALVPAELRKSIGPGKRVGYFHHIPFPAPEIHRVLPWAREILHGLLGADLVGFHTDSYVQNFISSCELLLGANVDRENTRVHWGGRWVKVGAFPIGIDVERFEHLASTPETVAAAEKLKREIRCEKLIIGVDRLDYTKGLKERVLAAEKFFERHPSWRGRLTFVQVAVPSRTRVEEYRQMKRELDEAVGRVNGRYAEPGWTPIRYIARSLEHPKLVPLYRAADVCLVTPLRDGMNLVAMEYVASRPDGGGALILSDQAGAIERLREAWPVNPRHISGVADTIAEVLRTPEEERASRMQSLLRAVRSGNVHRWTRTFLADLLAPG